MEIHPMLVHFPIALLLASVLFDLIGTLRRDERFHHAGYFTLIGGFAGAIVSFISGNARAEQMMSRFSQLQETMGAAGGIPGGFPGADMGGNIMQIISVHKLLALSVLAVFLVLVVWRVSKKGLLDGRSLTSYLLLAVIGTGLVAATGLYGGEIRGGGRGGRPGGQFQQEFRLNQQGGGMQFDMGSPAGDDAASDSSPADSPAE